MPQAARLLTLASRLRERAQPPRPPELLPVVIAGQTVGWTRPDVAQFLVERETACFQLRAGLLTLLDDGWDAAQRTGALDGVARRLRDAGFVRGWRDESLALRAHPGSPPLARIERAVCRTFGFTTEAVHLNAFGDDGTLFVARRAAHKSIDPGLWDNLVGGMVPAGEDLEQALEREAWEEAGLELDRLEVHRGRRFHVRRSVAEGYQSEHIHVYEVTLAADASCINQDGEVDAIDRRPLPEVVDAIERGEFTLESALATLESLSRRGGFTMPPGLFE